MHPRATALAWRASLLALTIAFAAPATAQQAPTAPASSPAPASADPATQTVAFAADSVTYDNSGDVMTAAGHVELQRDAWKLSANEVVWNRRTGSVVARGSVVLTNPQGDVAYGDEVELTDSLRDGVVANLLVVFEQGGRLAATRGERFENGNMELEQATYSPCPIDGSDGCPRQPSWVVRAARVTYDAAAQRMRYTGARVQLFGISSFPLPGLSHPVGTAAGTGFLVPDFRVDRVNGVEIALPYYIETSPSLDVLLTPHIYTNSAPLLEAEARGLAARGAWRVRGLGTYSQRVPVGGGTASTGQNVLRGYIDAAAGYQFTPEWSAAGSFRVASDRTFLRRYDISRDDRLRSTVSLMRHGDNSFLNISGWATQTLRVNDAQGQQPIALPLIDYLHRFDGAPFGGTMMIEANSLSLIRRGGQDTQRAFASAQWDWRRLTTMGQEVHLTVMGRGDIYHTDSIDLTSIADYRGSAGWQARAYTLAAAEISWPLVGALGRGMQRIVPRVQIVATSPVDNVNIPNEDSRAFELADDNIFALNRFPGYDRFEDGARITYGFEYEYRQRGLAVSTSLAQSYQLDNRAPPFTPGTGLSQRVSDIVGRTTIAYRNSIRLTHRFRLDKDTLAFRRNEIDMTIGTQRTYAVIGYSRLNRDISSLGEDLRDREEARVGARVQIARYWSMFGSAIVDLTNRSEDPLSVSDGFTPIRHRIGIQYEDDCLTIGVTWRRDYQDTGDARAGNSFLLRLAFRNLGV